MRVLGIENTFQSAKSKFAGTEDAVLSVSNMIVLFKRNTSQTHTKNFFKAPIRALIRHCNGFLLGSDSVVVRTEYQF